MRYENLYYMKFHELQKSILSGDKSIASKTCLQVIGMRNMESYLNGESNVYQDLDGLIKEFNEIFEEDFD